MVMTLTGGDAAPKILIAVLDMIGMRRDRKRRMGSCYQCGIGHGDGDAGFDNW